MRFAASSSKAWRRGRRSPRAWTPWRRPWPRKPSSPMCALPTSKRRWQRHTARWMTASARSPTSAATLPPHWRSDEAQERASRMAVAAGERCDGWKRGVGAGARSVTMTAALRRFADGGRLAAPLPQSWSHPRLCHSAILAPHRRFRLTGRSHPSHAVPPPAAPPRKGSARSAARAATARAGSTRIHSAFACSASDRCTSSDGDGSACAAVSSDAHPSAPHAPTSANRQLAPLVMQLARQPSPPRRPAPAAPLPSHPPPALPLSGGAAAPRAAAASSVPEYLTPACRLPRACWLPRACQLPQACHATQLARLGHRQVRLQRLVHPCCAVVPRVAVEEAAQRGSSRTRRSRSPARTQGHYLAHFS